MPETVPHGYRLHLSASSGHTPQSDQVRLMESQGVSTKRFTSTSGPVLVRQSDLAQVLQAIRRSRRESPETVAANLSSIVKRKANEQKNEWSASAELLGSRGIESLESSTDGFTTIHFADLKLLADAYGIHRLLLDSLISEGTDDICEVQAFDEFINVGDMVTVEYGEHAKYRVPARRLTDAPHIAIVDLSIDPGGRSDVHWHPGDELIFVRQGSVDITVGEYEMRARLNAGDYIHFYAEQEHCAVNAGAEQAELFIVRILPAKCRVDFHDWLRTFSSRIKGHGKSNSQSSGYALAVRDLADYIVPHRFNDQELWHDWEDMPVSDRLGLGRFLIRWCGYWKESGISLDELAVLGARKGFNRSRLHRVHYGLAPVKGIDLLTIAEIYRIEPVLLFEFLIPTSGLVVVVRQSPNLVTSQREFLDLHEIAAPFVPNDMVSYRVPFRRLAETETSIALLRLAPGGQTPDNRHPGHEIILPLEGKMEIRFGTTHTALDSSSKVCAQFHSGRRHRLVNVGDATAQALVIRVAG
jgi:quercetin dioxygenase-like cupin family protein